MNILTKGLLLIAVPTLCETLLLGFLFQAQSNAADADRWSLHSKQVLTQIGLAEEPVLREQASIRRAVIVQDATARGDAAFWSDLDARLQRLKVLVADDPAQVQHIKELLATVNAFHQWDDAVADDILHNRQASAAERIRDNSGRILVTRFLAQISDFLKEEQAVDAQRTTASIEARRHQQIILLITAIGSLLAAAVALYLFTRAIAGRLSVLTANARHLADGTPLAAPVRGKDEIAQLDRVLHETGQRLADAAAAEQGFKAELQKRADELAVTNEQLRQQTQENEMFIYSVSHDLRSPLVNLQGFSKELHHACADLRRTIDSLDVPAYRKKELAVIFDTDIGESLRFLQTAVIRAANIIDALLRLSRAGRVEYQNKRVDVAAIIRRVVDAMQATIQEKGATVRIHDLPDAMGDPAAIEQIFGNLVGNAINYLDPNRPGQIDIGSQELPPEERIEYAPQRIYFVKDNGLGIPQAYMGKMFTAFQRLHGNIAQGEGIGLAIVRRVVERHGGRIWVESKDGVGTTFFVRLSSF